MVRCSSKRTTGWWVETRVPRGSELVYSGHLLLAFRIIFEMRKIGVLFVFSLFLTGVGVYCECRCVYTLSACVFVRVHGTHVYSYTGRRDEILDWALFFFNIFLLPEKKGKRCQHVTEDSNLSSVKPIWARRPSITKGAKLRFTVIKAIIIIMGLKGKTVRIEVQINTTHMYIYIHMFIYLCMYVYINVCVYIYVCIYLHIYVHIHIYWLVLLLSLHKK